MKKFVLLFTLSVSIVISGKAQSICFNSAYENRYETESFCMDVGAFDVNNDGYLDIVASGGSEVSISLGNGDGTFQPEYTSFPGTNNDIEFIDFDGDGDLDFYSYGFGNCVAGRNLGDGTFEWAGYMGVTLINDQFSEMSVGDVTGDGHPDIVINDRGGDIFIIETDEDGIPESQFVLDVLDSPINVKVGDLNDDAIMDIAVASSSEDLVGIYIAQGGQTFVEILQSSSPNMGSGYATIEIDDITGDGHNDIMVGGQAEMRVLMNDGDGTFTTMPSVFTGTYCQGATTGDWDGDGDADVAWANHTSGGVTVVLNNGDGTFPNNSATFFSSQGQSEELVAADFDQDGILDLVVANGFHMNFSFMKGNGDGRFGPLELLTGYGASGICSADFDNDGDIDVIATNYYLPSSLALSKNLGDGTFEETIFIENPNGAGECVAGDFDEDGNQDVAVHSTQGISIHLGNGDGTFDAFQTFASSNLGGGGDRTICTGDFNGDDHLDLAGSLAGANSVAVIYGDGNGDFSESSIYDNGIGYARTIRAGHLNNDAYEDFVVCSNSTNEVFVYFGNATQTLGDPLILNTPGDPEGLSIFDANEDGANDLIVVAPNANVFHIFIGNNDQTFNAATTSPIPAGSNATKGAHDDINGDGHEDLVCALYEEDAVGIFFGNGDGTFQEGISYEVDRRPINAIVADFNGDGNPDFSTLNSGVNNISVILNNSAFITVDGELEFCEDESVTLTASEGFSYEWSNGETTQSITTNQSGTYYCSITNQAGTCTIMTTSVEVQVFADFPFSFSLDSTLVCVENGSFNLTGGLPWGGTYSGTGVNGSVFDPEVAGEGTFTITYTYTDAGNCNNGTATDELTVDICLGIEEEEFVTEVFPTITSNFINIRTKTSFYTQLFDSNGKLIHSGKQANRFETIDMSALSTGIYLLHITDGTNRQVVRVQKVD